MNDPSTTLIDDDMHTFNIPVSIFHTDAKRYLGKSFSAEEIVEKESIMDDYLTDREFEESKHIVFNYDYCRNVSAAKNKFNHSQVPYNQSIQSTSSILDESCTTEYLENKSIHECSYSDELDIMPIKKTFPKTSRLSIPQLDLPKLYLHEEIRSRSAMNNQYPNYSSSKKGVKYLENEEELKTVEWRLSDLQNMRERESFLIHKMLFRREFDKIKYMFETNLLTKEDLDEYDVRGNTPLILAAKLSKDHQAYLNIIQYFLVKGASFMMRDKRGWSVMDQAISAVNTRLVVLLYDFYSQFWKELWIKKKNNIVEKLLKIDDFYMELHWVFKSSIIPLVSKLAPSDTFKIWKKGSSLRLDFSLVGWQKLRTKRRNMSLVFRDSSKASDKYKEYDLLLINRSKKIIVNPLEEADHEEKVAVLKDMLNSDPVQGELNIMDHDFKQCKGMMGKPTSKKVANWMCNKFQLSFKTNMLTRIKKEEDFEYTIGNYFKQDANESAIEEISMQASHTFGSSANIFSSKKSALDHEAGNEKTTNKSRQINRFLKNSKSTLEDTPKKMLKKTNSSKEEVKSYSKNMTCDMWMSHDFPIQMDKIQTVFETLSHGNKALSKLQEILKDEVVQELFVKHGFPVKIQIPIGFSINGVVTFIKFEDFKESDENIFDLPTDYNLVNRKEGMKTMKNKKKRLVMAKFNL